MADTGKEPAAMRWLPPSVTAALARCEFLARTMKLGFVSGRHRSPMKGFSVEFAEHRQYVPGDDPRNLDWKVLARKDRLYVRQYEDETNLRATILVDCSASMQYAGERAAEVAGRKLSKFDCACHLAAAMAYLLSGQQDAVGLALFDSRVRTFLPARARSSQLRIILETLSRAAAGPDTALAPVFDEIAERIPARGLVIVISDFFDPDSKAVLKALHHFNHRRHEIVAFHVMAEEELSFDFHGPVRFEDLEGPGRLEFDAEGVRAAYLANVKRFLAALGDGIRGLRADYVPVNTSIPFERTLAEYLVRRRGGAS